MKTLLVCLNAKYIHASSAPYLLRAGLRRYGKLVKDAAILDATVNEDEESLLSRILGEKPDFIGFSTYIWNVSLVLRLAARVKAALPDILICLGGPEVTSRADRLLAVHPALDMILEGEGERALPALLDALAAGAATDTVAGLTRRGEESLSPYKRAVCEEFLSPLDGGYAEALGGRIAYFETSRGCPFGCAFCLSGGARLRFADEVESIRSLIRLASLGVRTIKLVDRTFNADRARALRILRALSREAGRSFPRGVTFHFELSGELLDMETVALLTSAPVGLFQLELGLQSTNRETLSAIGRSGEYTKIIDAARRIAASGRCHVHLDLIAGLPHETLASWERGFHEALSARPQMLQLGFLKLLPGTELDQKRKEFGLIASPEPPYEVTETPSLRADELAALHRLETAFDRLYNSGRHRRTIHYLTEVAGIEPLAFYREVGESLAASPAVGLDALTERLLLLYGEGRGADRALLLDAMLTDRIATNRNSRLPTYLKRYDPRIKRHRARMRDGIPRGYASLSDGRLLVAEYTEKHPVTGEYELKEITEL